MNSSFTRGFRAISIALLIQFSPQAFAASYDQMIVFGDSISDNGNFAALLGPAGLGPLNYDSRRFTDGPGTTPASAITGVPVEQLNQLLGLPTLVPSILGGTNYAWGQATTGSSTLDPVHGTTPGTGAQIADYLSSHPQASPDSLYVLWAGANDFLNSTTPAGIQDAETIAIGNLRLQITTLLNAGAKNILWFGLPDFSLAPAAVLAGPVLAQQLHLSALQFQQDWANSLQSFQASYSDANIVGVDAYAFLYSLVNQPSAYGLTNVTTPAQGQVGINPDEYLFWDAVHPTTKADAAVANFAFQQLTAAVPEASSGMYVGLLVVGLVLRRVWASKKITSRTF